MFVIIGIVVVFGAVMAGYLMEKGSVRVLVQPAELVIIGGAAIGTVLIANSLYILKAIVGGITGAFGGSKFGKDKYLETMKMMYELFSRARKEGLIALETDSDAPDKSPVFSKYPKFLKDHHALHFVCDTLRMAAALVGTFLGILLCYGLIGPLAANMSKGADEEHAYYYVLRVTMAALMRGTPPTVAVEFGRRAIPGNVRPTFQDTENHIENKGDAGAGGGEAPPAETAAA
jgi:flagellar motor component MotA